MKNPDYQRENLNQSAFEMMLLCQKQMRKAADAFMNNDIDLAEEVIHRENRVNAQDLKIERDCERYMALFNPVASDLRFAMSILKINYNLERIGDHAFDLANYIVDYEKAIDASLLEKIEFEKMVSTMESMFDDVIEAYDELDPKRARKVFKKDKTLNKINKKTKEVVGETIRANVETTEEALLIFAVIKKLERVGDLLKNISEGIIFYLEAEVLVHKKNVK
jgi:phosphate transport system protein